MDGWMDGWMYRCLYVCRCVYDCMCLVEVNCMHIANYEISNKFAAVPHLHSFSVALEHVACTRLR